MLGAMTKRRRMLGLVAVAAVGLLPLATWWTLSRPDAWTIVSSGRIVEGMTDAEVDAILGPALVVYYPEDYGLPGPKLHCIKTWDVRYGVSVDFDAAGRVMDTFCASEKAPWYSEIWGRIQQRFGW